MQTQTRPTRPAWRARAVPGKHVKGPRTVRRILITGLMLGVLAVSSLAASGLTSRHANSHHTRSAVSSVGYPWMY